MRFTQIFPNKVIHYKCELGDANKLILTDVDTDKTEEFVVNACADDKNNIDCTFQTIFGDFGTLKSGIETPINYYNMRIIFQLDENQNMTLISPSKCVFGFNKENSFMDVVTYPIIATEKYKFLQEQFKAGFGNCLSVDQFLSFLFTIDYGMDFNNIMDIIENTFRSSALLPSKDLNLVDFKDKSYNCVLVTQVNTNNHEQILLESIASCFLQSIGMSVNIYDQSHLKDVSEDDLINQLNFKDENVDFWFLINHNEIENIPKDTFGAVFQIRSGLFTTTRHIIKRLPLMLEQATERRLQCRNEMMKDALAKELKKGQKGGCSGPKADGGCCGGGCGGSSNTEEDQPEVVDKLHQNMSCGSSNCCSKDKPKVQKDMGCGMGNDCCSINEDQPDCEKVREEESKENTSSCGGSCGGSCSFIQEEVRQANIEKTGCCKGDLDNCCKK